MSLCLVKQQNPTKNHLFHIKIWTIIIISPFYSLFPNPLFIFPTSLFYSSFTRVYPNPSRRAVPPFVLSASLFLLHTLFFSSSYWQWPPILFSILLSSNIHIVIKKEITPLKKAKQAAPFIWFYIQISDPFWTIKRKCNCQSEADTWPCNYKLFSPFIISPNRPNKSTLTFIAEKGWLSHWTFHNRDGHGKS